MDDVSTLFLTIISVLLSVLLGILFAYLHSLNEKVSRIQIDLSEIKGLIRNPRKR
jgi:ABC-type Fe3+ transport system permease subunit